MANLLWLQGCLRSRKYGLESASPPGLGPKACARLGPVLAVGCAVSTFAFAAAATADQAVPGDHAGSILVRAHVLGVFPEDASNKIPTIGGTADISNRVAPEVDLSYFYTDHIAAQLIATLTRASIKANNTAAGNFAIGAVDVLPPTLTAQYHFTPHAAFDPYAGAGATFFILFASDPARGAGIVSGLHTDSHVGLALQGGFDYNLAPRWVLNLELNQVFVGTHATVNSVAGTVRARVDVNPFLVGAGVGYRF